MHRTEEATVNDLRRQVQSLQQRLGELHCADANMLRRANVSLSQHTEELVAELRAVQHAARQLDGNEAVFSGKACANQAAQTIGVLWFGNVCSYWLRRAFRLGAKGSNILLVATLLSATVPLGVKAHRRLRNLLVRNPRTVDSLLRSLEVLETRVSIMRDLTAGGEGGSGALGGGETSGDDADLVHVTSADLRGSGLSGGTATVVAPSGSGEGVVISRDIVREGVGMVAEVAQGQGGEPGVPVCTRIPEGPRVM